MGNKLKDHYCDHLVPLTPDFISSNEYRNGRQLRFSPHAAAVQSNCKIYQSRCLNNGERGLRRYRTRIRQKTHFYKKTLLLGIPRVVSRTISLSLSLSLFFDSLPFLFPPFSHLPASSPPVSFFPLPPYCAMAFSLTPCTSVFQLESKT